MIPKIIHYCWFGGKPLPAFAKKCIASWKKYCPDYEIKEWNESNFDLNSCEYVKEAYQAKKYAFVSDYARFDILYRYGGVYFDTDVELLKPMDPFVAEGSFMGVESLEEKEGKISVAPGLGIAATPEHPLYRELLDFYHTIHFLCPDGSLNYDTVVFYTTNILKKHGLQACSGIQRVGGITVYPKEFFNPCDMETKKIIVTENTVSIHYYAGSWLTNKKKFKRFVRKIVGNRIYLFLYRIKNKEHHEKE